MITYLTILVFFSVLFYKLKPIRRVTDEESEHIQEKKNQARIIYEWSGSQFVEVFNPKAKNSDLILKVNPVTGIYEEIN